MFTCCGSRSLLAPLANGCQERLPTRGSQGNCVHASSTGLCLLPICKLTKSLYGLKKAPRAWFDKFRFVILQANFYQSSNDNDSSPFIRRSSRGCTILLIYVNDMILSGNDQAGISELKSHLKSTFKMKDLGPLTYVLGLEIQWNMDGIRVTQSKYADQLIHFALLGDAKTFATPIKINVKISKEDGHPLTNLTLFRHLVGSLLYLTMTWPDISHVVQTISQFNYNPHKPHLEAAYRILHNVKGTHNRGLLYPSASSLVITIASIC